MAKFTEANPSIGRPLGSRLGEGARPTAAAAAYATAAAKPMSPALQDVLRTPRFTQSVLWLACTTSIAMYGIVVWLKRDQPISGTLPAPLEIACYVAAVAGAAGFLFYRRRMLSAEHLISVFRKDADPIALATDPRTRVVNEQLRRQIEMLAPFERHFLAAFNAMLTPMVVSLAFSTIIAIAGMILALDKGDPILYLPFALVSASLNALVWPSPKRLEEVLRDAGAGTN